MLGLLNSSDVREQRLMHGSLDKEQWLHILLAIVPMPLLIIHLGEAFLDEVPKLV